MYAHQKIVQLLCLLTEGESPFDTVMSTLSKNGLVKKWHKNYLESITVIESTALGMFKTLCSLVMNANPDNEVLGRTIQGLKENRDTSVDGKFVSWGKGSFLHTLLDTVFTYNTDKTLETELRTLFIATSNKQREISAAYESKFQQKLAEIEAFFDEDIEYAHERKLEILEREAKDSGLYKKKLSHGQVFVGPTAELYDAQNGFGWLYDDDALLYRGEFRDGLFEGKGELFDGTLTQNRIFLGDFRGGKPNGCGVLYQAGKPIFRGQVLEGAKHGLGEELVDGKMVYRGYYYNNNRDGFGVIYHKNGRRAFMGEFKSGMKHGLGKEYDIGGVQTVEAMYEEGELKKAVQNC